MRPDIVAQADFHSADLAGRSFEDVVFWKGNFASTKWRGASCVNAVFDHGDFTLANVADGVFRDVRFKGCKLVGVDFRKCRTALLVIAFEDCLLDMCLFDRLSLAGTCFRSCVARDCHFDGADLQRADFHGTDLERSSFDGADLRHADFTGAKNYAIDPRHTNVQGAAFSLPEAISLLAAFDVNLRGE